MKRKLSVILLCLLAVVCIVLVACVDDPTAGGLPTDVPESATEPTLVLHYEGKIPTITSSGDFGFGRTAEKKGSCLS